MLRDSENVQLENQSGHPAKLGMSKVKNRRKKIFESCSSTSVRVVGKKINISQPFRYTIKVHKLGIKAISKNFHQIVSPWKKLESKKVVRNFSRKCLKN